MEPSLTLTWSGFLSWMLSHSSLLMISTSSSLFSTSDSGVQSCRSQGAEGAGTCTWTWTFCHPD